MPVFGSPGLAVLASVVVDEPPTGVVAELPVDAVPVVDPVPVEVPVLGEPELDPPPPADPVTTTVPCMNGWMEQM
jgi:hypothetical protein